VRECDESGTGRNLVRALLGDETCRRRKRRCVENLKRKIVGEAKSVDVEPARRGKTHYPGA
jgi:hypothetical protein